MPSIPTIPVPSLPATTSEANTGNVGRPSFTRARSRSTGARSLNGATSPPPEPIKGPWKPEVAFHASITASWAAIGVLWIITPLSYLYVLWTLLTLIPALASARPAKSGALQIIHYIVLAYCAIEIPFSIYYKFLSYQAQARRSTPQYTRRYLRDVFKKSLENGLDYDGEEEGDPLSALALGEALTRESGRRMEGESEHGEGKGSFVMRKRKALGNRGTPDLSVSDLPVLERSPVGPSSKVGGGGGSSSSEEEEVVLKDRDSGYTPSFIRKPLSRNDPRARDFRNFLRLWFNNCKYDEIWRLNMADWLSWSLYGQPYEEILSEHEIWESAGRPPFHLEGELDVDEEGLTIPLSKLGLVNHCVDLVEARSATIFKPGRNDKIKVIRLTLDPVRVWSRPVILYGFVWCAQRLVRANASRYGLNEFRDGDTRYLYRIPPGWTPCKTCLEAQRPLLFFHGLGMGLPQYATFLNYLCTSKSLVDRPIIILIQPSISMAFFSKGYLDPPDQKTCTDGINRIAVRHGFDNSGFTVISHSNGTIVHAWLLKSYPQLVVRSCFVDPVCFCLWEPWVCYNFLYSSPRTPIEYLMRYFVSRELGIALMLQRSFNWSSNLLFPSQIPNLEDPWKSAFFLAGKDSILNAERVRSYLKKHGVVESGNEDLGEGGLVVHEENSHGESMIGTGEAFNKIVEWIKWEQATDTDESEGAQT